MRALGFSTEQTQTIEAMATTNEQGRIGAEEVYTRTHMHMHIRTCICTGRIGAEEVPWARVRLRAKSKGEGEGEGEGEAEGEE